MTSVKVRVISTVAAFLIKHPYSARVTALLTYYKPFATSFRGHTTLSSHLSRPVSHPHGYKSCCVRSSLTSHQYYMASSSSKFDGLPTADSINIIQCVTVGSTQDEARRILQEKESALTSTESKSMGRFHVRFS